MRMRMMRSSSSSSRAAAAAGNLIRFVSYSLLLLGVDVAGLILPVARHVRPQGSLGNTARYVSASSSSPSSDFFSTSGSSSREDDSSPLPWASLPPSFRIADDEDLDNEDWEEMALERKKRLVQHRLRQQQQQASMRSLHLNLQPLPQVGKTYAEVGVRLIRIHGGKPIVESELDLSSFEIRPRLTSTTNSVTDDQLDKQVEWERFNPSLVLPKLDSSFNGVLVSSVAKDSVAWQHGIRPGDILRAISVSNDPKAKAAPMNTLEGIRSTLSSRRATSSAVDLQFESLSEVTQRNLFELTLTKPLGFQIQETDDGWVEVSAIHDNAPNLVRYAVQVGDRVVAVDSTLGDKLWPVSTVEGVISACTSRLPGQAIRLQFERPANKMTMDRSSKTSVATTTTTRTRNGQDTTTATNKPWAVVPSSTSGNAITTNPASATTANIGTDKKQLITRCREVLKRYSIEKAKSQPLISSKLDKVPALVADKVVDALASAFATVDSVTLSMIMHAYLSCDQTEDILRVFEAAVGFRADGSLLPITDTIHRKNGQGRLLPNESALNLVTATILIQAHGKRGDLGAVSRIVAAIEGRSGEDVDGLEVAPWPWTGTYGSIQPDTQFYNVALAAAEKIGGSEALTFAQAVSVKMRDPKVKADDAQGKKPVKDLVTYNTLMSILGNAGHAKDVFRLFDQMKHTGIRPDSYTYSSLIKSCSHEGDMEEILYDMKERGIQPDVITYNTIIKSLCAERRWSQAAKLVTEMESKGISPDSMTYGLLMSAMLKADKASACLTLFESACANERTFSLAQNVYLYTMAITAASTLKDHERALELVSRMAANGVKPNLKTMTSVMGACMAAKRYDLAYQIYQRIDAPDGYAMTQGLRALCQLGELRQAAGILIRQRRGKRLMSGKDMMLGYKAVIGDALTVKDYTLAREILLDLLAKGYIPSSLIFSTISDAFEVDKLSIIEPNDDDRLRFKFLLFVLDALRNRNLPVDGNLYATTLILGRQMGGTYRRLANLMLQSKTNAGTTREEIISLSPTGVSLSQQLEPDGWETLLDALNDAIENDSDRVVASYPALSVRVSSRDLKRLFRAEQAVLFKGRKTKRAIATTTEI